MDNKYQVPIINKEDRSDLLYEYFKSDEYKVEKLKTGQTVNINKLENAVIYIINGELKLVISNDFGVEKLLFFYHENTFCSPYLKELVEVFNLELVVDKDCEIKYIPRSEFIGYLMGDSSRFDLIQDALGKRLAMLFSNMLALQSVTSRNRVYNFIYQMALRENEEKSILISNFPSKNDISLITGVHKRNVYKYFAELEEMGIIQKVKHDILVKDIGRLRTLIEEGEKS